MGQKMQHDFEVYGSKGSLVFTQDRLNELHFYSADDPAGRRGFRRIEAGPEHEPFGSFCPAAGHQIGFNDMKAIEVARFVQAIAGTRPEPYNFRSGQRIQELVEAVVRSSRERRWVDLASK
jgi:predicted dehydrogenase